MRPNAARHSQRTRRTTKIHKGRRRKRNRRFHRFGQIWGRLPPAGRAMEAWKFGGLEVWLFPHDGLSRRPAGAFCSRGRFAASPLHAPFSVFRSPGRVSAPCPICPTATSFGTSQTCRGCRGNWKLGSLEAWLFRWGSAILPSSPQRGASYISYTPFGEKCSPNSDVCGKGRRDFFFPEMAFGHTHDKRLKRSLIHLKRQAICRQKVEGQNRGSTFVAVQERVTLAKGNQQRRRHFRQRGIQKIPTHRHLWSRNSRLHCA